ncbi:MAG TPA: helix-turn-helix transcriptional regulator [Pseudogracilibacillus sp.]|nr:helix-turn-helix transcriptional regulator [Pseudogracilibacillus sp.]
MLLKKIRLSKKLTQKEVAEKIGLQIRQYQYVESGQSFLSQEKMNKLEDLFQLPQRVLFSDSKENIPDIYKEFVSEL